MLKKDYNLSLLKHIIFNKIQIQAISLLEKKVFYSKLDEKKVLIYTKTFSENIKQLDHEAIKKYLMSFEFPEKSPNNFYKVCANNFDEKIKSPFYRQFEIQ